MKSDLGSIKSSKSLLIHVSGAGIGCALAIVLYLGVIKPTFDAQREAKQLSDSLAERSQKLEAMILQIDRAKESTESLTQQLSGAVGLQEASQLNRYVQRVVELAEQSRCKISEAKPGEYQPVSADYGRVPIELKCEGKPEDIIGFIRAMHGTHRDTDVVAYAMTTQMAGQRAYASGTMSLKWYTLPEGTIADTANRAVSNDAGTSSGRADAAEQTK